MQKLTELVSTLRENNREFSNIQDNSVHSSHNPLKRQGVDY